MREGREMIYVCVGAVALFALASAFAADSAAAEPAGNPVVILDTSAGPITIELDEEKAPITVANFLGYVDSGFYDNLIFHRVMAGFMIQGGGMDDQMNEKKTKAPIKNEGKNGLTNARGTLAMARTNNPDTATAQFFINLVDNGRSLGPGGVSPAGYAVFGKVIDGMETVDEIAKASTGFKKGHDDVPIKPIYIKSAKRKAD